MVPALKERGEKASATLGKLDGPEAKLPSKLRRSETRILQFGFNDWDFSKEAEDGKKLRFGTDDAGWNAKLHDRFWGHESAFPGTLLSNLSWAIAEFCFSRTRPN